MNSKDEKYFPSDYDEYYYYCRISIVEEAKEKYIRCSGLLLGSELNNSSAMKYSETLWGVYGNTSCFAGDIYCCYKILKYVDSDIIISHSSNFFSNQTDQF